MNVLLKQVCWVFLLLISYYLCSEILVYRREKLTYMKWSQHKAQFVNVNNVKQDKFQQFGHTASSASGDISISSTSGDTSTSSTSGDTSTSSTRSDSTTISTSSPSATRGTVGDTTASFSTTYTKSSTVGDSTTGRTSEDNTGSNTHGDTNISNNKGDMTIISTNNVTDLHEENIPLYRSWNYYILPDNSTISLPQIPESRKDLLPFRPLITEDEKKLLLQLVEVVDKTCLKHNITCLLDGGSLMGSLRHNDMIPWDDDIDMVYFSFQEEALVKALNNISPDYEAYNNRGHTKFMHKTSIQYNVKKPWRWPFIDMFSVEDNSTHIRYSHFTAPKSSIWPIRRRQFGPIRVSAPKNAELWMMLHYGKSWNTKCKSLNRSHKFEDLMSHIPGAKRMTVKPCRELYQYYPFMRMNHGKQKLMVGNRTVYRPH